MTEALKLIKRLGYVYFFAMLVAPLGYLLRILYAKGLSVEAYGTFYAIIALLSVLLVFSDMGFSQALIYYLPKYRKNHKQCKAATTYALMVHSATALVFGIGLFFLSPFLSEYYFKTPLAEAPLKILAIYFAVWTIGRSIVAVYKGFQLEKYWATWELLRLGPIVLLTLLLYNYVDENRIVWIALIWTAVLAVRFLGYFVVLLKKFKFLVKEKFVHSPKMFKQMRLYSFGIIAATGAAALLGNVDVLILTYLKSVKETALYNIALPSVQIVMVLIGPLASFLHPLVANYYHRGAKAKIAAITRLVYTTGFFLMLPFFVMFFFYSDLVIRVLFGSEYLAANNALKILIIATLPKVFYILNFTILAGIGKIKEQAKLFWGGLAANVALDFMLIPYFSIVGAAISTTVAYFFMCIFSYRALNKILKVNIPYKHFLLNIINAAIFLGVVAILKKIFEFNVWIELGSILLISGTIYLLLGIFLFRTLNLQELYSLFFRR